MLLTNKVCLLQSLCWSSVVLIMPAAIAQEPQTSVNFQAVTAEAGVTNSPISSVNDTRNPAAAPRLKSTLKSSDFTTSASGLMPVELTPATATSSGTTEQPSPVLLPAQTAESSTTQLVPLNLELAQVRPAGNGVSGPPEPLYPSPAVAPGNGTPATSPGVPEPSTPPPAPSTSSQSATPVNKWHFLFQPYVYTPLSIYGHATVRGYRADFTAGPSDIYSAFGKTFEFGLMGRLEGWSPDYHWGVVLNGDYLKLGKQGSFTRPNPDRFLDLAVNRIANRIQTQMDDVLRQQIADYLQGKLDGTIQAQIEARLGAKLATIIPSSFRSDVHVQTWNVDLAGSYRFYNPSQVNPKGVATEFDLGPYLLDVAVGVRISGTSGDLDVTTNLGGEGDFSRSVTTVKPLLATRFRYNFSPYLAGVVTGIIAGFDIGSLGLNWEVAGGVDWMFSGNTSVGLGYRFTYLHATSGSSKNEFEISASSNGPYLTFTFRF